jgi:DNA (cytosine-5)-methyltransferase 1
MSYLYSYRDNLPRLLEEINLQKTSIKIPSFIAHDLIDAYQIWERTGYAKRLSWDEPALTITCSPAQTQTERCHPEETRPLTVRKYTRVQSFPDDWQFTSNLTSQYRQIGNAVPVNMGYQLGCCLINMLQGDYLRETKPITQQLSILGLELN